MILVSLCFVDETQVRWGSKKLDVKANNKPMRRSEELQFVVRP
jgi:hypothetical protein